MNTNEVQPIQTEEPPELMLIDVRYLPSTPNRPDRIKLSWLERKQTRTIEDRAEHGNPTKQAVRALNKAGVWVAAISPTHGLSVAVESSVCLLVVPTSEKGALHRFFSEKDTISLPRIDATEEPASF